MLENHINPNALLINLPKDKDRLKNFQKKSLPNLQPYFKVQKTNGLVLTKTNIQILKESGYVSPMWYGRKAGFTQLGHYGASFAHLSLWTAFCFRRDLKKDMRYRLILEDDALIGEGFLLELKKMLLLLEQKDYLDFSVLPLHVQRHNIEGVKPLLFKPLKKLNTAHGFYCYLLNPKNIHQAMSYCYPIDMPIDTAFRLRSPKGTMYGLLPSVSHAKAPSNTGSPL